MSIYFFEHIAPTHSFLGGKGYTLGIMKNAGFDVPDGLILTNLPDTEEEWNQIISWWKKQSNAKLAIRSSAIGEDSKEQSFAGQNSTYLNVDTETGIKNAVAKCFQSINKNSSTLYRNHFLEKAEDQAQMNVVLQVMVDPKLSGVFFSVDPRTNEKGWIVEAIEGLGEDLVSGKKTPWHFEENKNATTSIFDIENLVKTGLKIRDLFGTEIDIEWAIDKNNTLKILQSRPITALAGKSAEKRLIENELKRLKTTYPKDTLWDGSTFAEWSGPPTELTFSIWKEAFSKGQAFSTALQKLGYQGINHEINNNTHSLLERIFNMGYVNISMLAPLYFGPIPYRLELKKTPKLKFDFQKMTLKTFILTPFTMFKMVKVSLDLSSRRHMWVADAIKELSEFTQKSFRIKDENYYNEFNDTDLFQTFDNEIKEFYQHTLVWPLVLITLIESTTQNLKALMKGVFSDADIDKKMNEWLSIGLHTVTMDMNNQYLDASINSEKRNFFLQKYGHRGPGELELSHPRWIELQDLAFVKITVKTKPLASKEQLSVENQIQNLTTYKKQIIEKEWLLLKEMLELREKWKMHLLSPYSHIRFLALEISKRFDLGNDIFWFSHQEILKKSFDKNLAKKRKADCEMSKSIYLPPFLELAKLSDILSSNNQQVQNIYSGVPLSPGVVFGEVRVVTDPENTDTENWPANIILVAESTDPGWTGLFLKSKAIIVEKGGVLSHCAIVAREMNLPAISGIKQCHLQFKDGDKLWVNGNNGRITLA